MSDVPSFPLRAAREAGVPGVVIANFTWPDIYRQYVETAEDDAAVRRHGDGVCAGDRALITPLSVPTVVRPVSAGDTDPVDRAAAVRCP